MQYFEQKSLQDPAKALAIMRRMRRANERNHCACPRHETVRRTRRAAVGVRKGRRDPLPFTEQKMNPLMACLNNR